MAAPCDDYFAYRRWFDPNHTAIEKEFPADCVEPEGPTFSYSNQYTWTLEWHLVFTNTPPSYVRIWEHFAKRSRLFLSRRISFVYHFGPNQKSNDRGVPEREPSDPVFVRIDNVGGPAHIHHGAPNPHIPQSKVQGITLEDVDMFDFVRAAISYQISGRALAEQLGYRII